MAKFCEKCGASLNPGSKFCPECGAKIVEVKKNDIKITQNDKGGLTFDVPEGSTVEISDSKAEKKKKAKAKKEAQPKKTEVKTEKPEKPKKKGGGFVKFVILLLVAAIGFTGFVKPGFFLKGRRPGGGYDQQQPTTGGNTVVNVELPEYSGNSKAFEKQVWDGVVIRAEKNAFNKDTDVKMAPLDEIPAQYDEILKEFEDEWMIPISIWEVDAGLADDEVIPGVFEVEVDLDTLDIDPAFYPCISVGRIGDDGSFYEYETTIKDNKLIYHSRQNSATVFLIGGAVVVLGGAAVMDYFNESKYFYSRRDYLKRYVEIKKYQTDYGSYELQWITSDIDRELGDKVNRMHEIEEDCKEQADEYEKTLESTKKLDRNKQKLSYYKYLLETNEEYLKLKEEVEIPQVIRETKKYIDTAYKYLGSVARVRMPSGKVIFLARTDSNTAENRNKLGLAEKLNYSTVVSLWPLKALTDQVNRDNYLLTITHELFHVCQERYRFSPPVADKFTDDPRYDEMVTMVLERDAKRYYQNNDIITTDPPLTDKVRWDTLRLPIDNEPDSKGTSDGKNLKMIEGYQLGDFVMYLQEEYKERTVTPHQLMKARSYLKKPGVSAPLMEAFGIDNETEFDLFFRKWLLARRRELTENCVQLFNQTDYYPKDWINLKPGDVYHLSLDKDGSYFLSLRGFKKKEAGELKGILVFDDDFRKNHPSVNLVPLVPDYIPTERGAYFGNISYLVIGEIYGKIEAGENMNVGYNLYTFEKTSAPTLDQSDDALIINLPKMKTYGAAKDRVIDGYVLKIQAGDKVIVDDEIDKEGFEQSLSYAKKELLKDDSRLDLSVTLCEFVRSKDGKRCLGVESDPVSISIGEDSSAKDRFYDNLYLYVDSTCRFDGDSFNYYIENENLTVGAWPKGSSVRISGNKVEVIFAAVDTSVSGSDPEEDITSMVARFTRPAITFTGEFESDYGENHLYYRMTGVSPGTFTGSETEDGTARESSYSNGETTYKYFKYGTQHTVTFSNYSSGGMIDVYFRNGDISSVEIQLPGKYATFDKYTREGEDPYERSNEVESSYKFELLR